MILKLLRRATPAFHFSLVVVAIAGMAYAMRAGAGRETADDYFHAFVQQMGSSEYKAARENIDAAVKLWPNNAYYLSGRGLVDERLMESPGTSRFLHPDQLLTPEDEQLINSAVGAYEKALAENPNDDCFHHNLGWLYWFLGQKDRSRDSFEKAIAINGGIALYHVSLGIFYEQISDLQSATLEYRAALRISPSLMDSPFFLDFQRRLPAQAESVRTGAIAYLEGRLETSGDPIVEGQLGKLYLGRNLGRAQELLTRATADLPSMSRTWSNLGKVYSTEGDEEQAQLCFRRAAFLDASDYIPLQALAEFYEQKNRPQEAIDCYRRAIDNWDQLMSVHAYRSARIYNSKFVVRDDIIPRGFLAYTEPAFDRGATCTRLSTLYRQVGDSAQAASFEQQSKRPVP
jgi:tetratricopeptide (TPR) repeat protein